MKKEVIWMMTAMAASFYACKKSDNSTTTTVSQPPFQIGQLVTGTNLSGSVKGTLQTGVTYTLVGDVNINRGDTLLIQPGAKVIGQSGYQIMVFGTFLSLGTQASPIYLTANLTKTDNTGANPNTDPAYSGTWGGIQCDTGANAVILKWTHLEFVGAVAPSNINPILGYTAGSPRYAVLTQNPKTIFVFEDSWLYGHVDDGLRIDGGKFHILRSTFEKGGQVGGEFVNVKGGSVGNVGYCLFIGGSTNGTKLSNVNQGSGPEAYIAVYNNTYINCGYRQASAGKGGSIDFEKGASGKAYNNLIVNCKVGLRIVGGSSTPDTVNLAYDYTYTYGDSLAVLEQVYPVGNITHPRAHDIPGISALFSGNYSLGESYTPPTSLQGANNPQFSGFPLPQIAPTLRSISYVGTATFKLNSGSPAIGKGFGGFTPVAPSGLIQSANFGYTTLTYPSTDFGAYPSAGGGNNH